MRIYIIGSGGIGGYFGGLLEKAGNDVTFVARGEHFHAIKNNGLTVKSVVGDFNVKPAQVIENIAEIVNPDLVIFSVKTYDTDNTTKELVSVVNKNTVIITFQNGVENDQQIKKQIKNAQVFPGVAYVISTKTKPGVIEQTGGLRKFIIGDRNNPDNPKIREIEKLMKNAGINVVVSNDIARDLWKKFIFVAAYSGMTSICRRPIGKILSDPLTKTLYERTLREAIAVAKAMKVNMEDHVFESIMTISCNTSPDSKSSLLVDIENDRKNEIENLNGTLVKFAKENKIDVPVNKLIYGAIKLLNK